MRLPEEPRLPPELPRLVLRLTDVLRDITRAINSIADQSTSTAVADLIGTALSMTITPKAPTATETPGALNLLARDAVGAGINGADVNVTAGNGESGGAINVNSGQGGVTGGRITMQTGLAATSALELADDGASALIGLYGAPPVARATTAVAAATFVANAGTAVNSSSTFDGYTIGKVVKALRNVGVLA
jgi:hypothetical protein